MSFNLDAPPRVLTGEQLQLRESRIQDSELYLDVGRENVHYFLGTFGVYHCGSLQRKVPSFAFPSWIPEDLI
jgi:hypothetical protein